MGDDIKNNNNNRDCLSKVQQRCHVHDRRLIGAVTSVLKSNHGCAHQQQLQLNLSGSETETDVSTTSTENLTNEERYVLRNWIRQEPQGEESIERSANIRASSPPSSSSSSSSSSCDLVVHDDDTDEDIQRTNYDDARLPMKTCSGHRRGHHKSSSGSPPMSNSSSSNSNIFKKCLQSSVHQVPSVPSSGVIVSSTTAQTQKAAAAAIDFDMSKLPPPPEYPGWLQMELASAQQQQQQHQVVDGNDDEDVEDDTHESHMSEVKSKAELMSSSQPDLRSLGRWEESSGNCRRNADLQPPNFRPRTKGKASTDVPPALLHQRACVKYRSHGDLQSMHDSGSNDHHQMPMHVNRYHRQDSKLIEKLISENRQLKCQLDSTSYKVYKLQKFEAEILKVHQAHEALIKSSQKREELEEKVKLKLQMELRRYQENNHELQAQLEAINGHLLVRQQSLISGSGSGGSGGSVVDMTHRDAFVAQLIQQNKELLAAKERHEIELAAQRVTLQEQRIHIDILDSALINAQANVVKLEEECRKKQSCVERVGQLQRALSSLQVASERRDTMARKLRCQMEKDIQLLRQQLKQQVQQQQQQQQQHDAASDNAVAAVEKNDGLHLADSEEEDRARANGSEDGDDVDDLKRMAREQQERIIALETEVSKWEQRYLEENAMRQIAIDAASMPKDARIAALERTSQESEKLIAQAHSDKLRHMDEVHAANKRCADLDARVRDLESRLAERDAMIRVLKHSMDKDGVYSSSGGGGGGSSSSSSAYQMRTPRTSFHMVDHRHCSSSSSSTFMSSQSATNNMTTVATTVAAVAAPASHAPSETPTSSKDAKQLTTVSPDVTASKESLDEQLKKLDSQLLSKDSIIQALRSEKEKYPNHYWMV